MAKKFKRRNVPHLNYSPNVLQLPLHWRAPFWWSDIKNRSPGEWPIDKILPALAPDRGGIYIFYDVPLSAYLYVGRSRNLRDRFAKYASAQVRKSERGIGQIDSYEATHSQSEIGIFVAHCTEIEYMFIKSAGRGGTAWNQQHNP